MTRILVFANSGPVTHDQLRSLEYDLIYCADAGARAALALGLIPDLVVGDFDSLTKNELEKIKEAGSAIIRHPHEKDYTDLELCLLEALKASASEVVILSALWGRLDHHLANLLLLTRDDFKHINFTVLDRDQTLWLVREGKELHIAGKAGDLLSLIPISETVSGVQLCGTKWPLRDAVLRRGDGRTISNLFVEDGVDLAVGEGLVFVVHQRQ